MEEEDNAIDRQRISTNYPLFQIAKAFETSEQHEDAETRKRAQAKISKWVAVINGILNDSLDIGSRSPVRGVPGWVTLEVIKGGFPTGELVAGGPLIDHERTLLNELGVIAEEDGRRVLNAYWLTDEGLNNLQEQLHSGCYDVVVPEEGAFLVAAYLVGKGYVEEARDLLGELMPFFSKLRFYPIPMEHPRQIGAEVYVQDVEQTILALKEIRPNQRILAQKEAIEVWIPFYDKMVKLFLETVMGDVPNLRRGPNGERIHLQNNKYQIEGGWPCQHYPAEWRTRAQKVLEEYKIKRNEHNLCGKPDRDKDSFAQLRKYLNQCVTAPQSLTGRDVGRIRLILARYNAKRDNPGSPKWKAARQRQVQQVSGSTFHMISKVVISRLEAYPKNSGIDQIEGIIEPITSDEARQWQINEGTLVPESQQKKIRRCLTDSIVNLVDLRVITSGETLARVLPQITSDISAAGITDPTLRRLYSAIYRAFRRRRSLLLLNLESQNRIEELPWIVAINRFRHDNLSTQELASHAFEEVTRLAIVSFPHAILPNKLLQELRTLSESAGLDIPLVDEIAADIFMGVFTDKYLEAAKRAGNILEGTIYETYYGLNYKRVRQIPKTKKNINSWFQSRTTISGDSLASLCSSRAGVNYMGWNPVINGMIIEQQQIYTSQNLAVLFSTLNFKDTLGVEVEKLAERCFIWICQRLQVKSDNWHARLIMVKNAAYAWRQMIFFLALLPKSKIQTFLILANDHLKEQELEFQIRFQPALQGLILAAEGHSLDDQEVDRSEVHRFLGWSKEKHWLLD